MKASTANSDIDPRLVVRRIVLIMLGLTVAGGIAWAIGGGSAGLKSFLAGAAISWVSFYLLHRFVADLGTALSGGKPHPLSFVVHAFRTLILGIAAYVILKWIQGVPNAVVTGLLVTVAAAVVEALIEQYYAS